MATSTKSTRLQAKQLSELSPHDFEAKHCCVLFVEDFTYDVVNLRMLIRTAKAIKVNSPEAAIGEIVTVKGFMSKVMQIGSKESCLKEQKKLEKALSVLENKQDDSEDIEDEGPTTTKKKRKNKSDSDQSDESESEKMNDIIAKENEKVKALLQTRKPDMNPSHIKTELASRSEELTSLKKHVDQVDNKLDMILDMLKSNSSSGSISSVGSGNESTPERKVKSTPQHLHESPSLHSIRDVAEAVMYKDVDLIKGHIPTKPALFATQRLSMLFSQEELATCTMDPSEKSGKLALEKERITLLFEALNKVYGENKIKKTQTLISQAIKQKCLDKLKQHRKQDLAK